MKTTKMAVYMLICFFIFTGPTALSYADDAQVLPKGIWRTSITSKFYFPVDERFNPDGDKEQIDVDFNTDLDSSVFPELKDVEDGFGMVSGSGTVGNSIVDIEERYTDYNVSLEYGVTEKLTIGIEIPYWYQKATIESSLDTTNATIGKSVNGVGFAAPLTPLAGGGPFLDAVPLTKDDILDLLSNGLDVDGDGTADIEGFGYDRLKTWSDSGISDIVAGFKYQYYNTDDWRLAYIGAVRFPTGKVDDPDNLIDVAFGDGAYALLFRMNNDYTGIENLVINTTFGYDLVLPEKEELRIPDSPDLFVTSNKEKVDRDIGDTFEAELSGDYAFYKDFDISLLYKYTHKAKDKVDGDQGFSYNSLEEESNIKSHIYMVGLSYSTIPLFEENKFPVPLTASVSYRNRFAGENIVQSEYISASLSLFF